MRKKPPPSEMPCSWYVCTRRATVHVSADEHYCRSHAAKVADKAARSFVMERDRRTCQRCGSQDRPLQAAHLIPRGQRFIHWEPENIVALCSGVNGCHEFLDARPATRTTWALDRWPGRIERLWALEAQGERRGDGVDLAAVIRGFREQELSPEEMERYRSGAWLG
jgi:5-methylcytosine-specific restriction endonuclease McrA